MAEVIIRLTDDDSGVAIDVGYTPAIAPDAKRNDDGLSPAQRLSLTIIDALRDKGAHTDGFVFREPAADDLPSPGELREQATALPLHPVCAACGAEIQPGQDVTMEGPDFVEGQPRIVSGADVVIKHVECPPLGAGADG